jgi:hypothetical protein
VHPAHSLPQTPLIRLFQVPAIPAGLTETGHGNRTVRIFSSFCNFVFSKQTRKVPCDCTDHCSEPVLQRTELCAVTHPMAHLHR